MSFQDGWIEVKKRKHRTEFLLRYWVRDLSQPAGWKKKSEILKGCTTRKQAERERMRRMEDINESNQASASTTLGPTAMTLEVFSRTVWSHYLQTRGAKESTLYGYESLLRAHILPALGSKRLDQITPSDVSVFLNQLARSKERPNSKGGPKLLNVYALLRTMFEVALESDLILASPLRKKIHRPKYRVAEKPVLDSEQLRTVLEKMPESWMTFFLCLALTTLRIGELIALHWSDVDWMRRKLTVTKTLWRGRLQHSTKTDVALVKHIPEVLFEALAELRRQSPFKADGDLIFCKADGGPCDPDWVRKNVLYSAMDRAGIDRGKRTHGFHIFRHTGGSIIRSVTGDMKLAQLQLGHSRMSTTSDIYVHTNEHDIQRAGEALAKMIGKVLPTKLPTKGHVVAHQAN